MFTGLIEEKSQVIKVEMEAQNLRLWLKRPVSFDDVKRGDSIATNGVCLTLEDFADDRLSFVIGPETLRRTHWNVDSLEKMNCNLERSLKFGDRIHGHMVTGHVDGLGRVKKVEDGPGFRELTIEADESLAPYLWEKGSVTVNGVSLTVNQVRGHEFDICLIPETLNVTNLSELVLGDSVNLEADYMARGLMRWMELNRSELDRERVQK